MGFEAIEINLVIDYYNFISYVTENIDVTIITLFRVILSCFRVNVGPLAKNPFEPLFNLKWKNREILVIEKALRNDMKNIIRQNLHYVLPLIE